MSDESRAKLRALFKRLLTRRGALLVAGGLLAIGLLGLATNWLWPRQVSFSYSRDTCFSNLVFFPNSVRHDAPQKLRATAAQPVTVLGFPVLSRSTCLSLIGISPANSTETVNLTIGNWRFMSQRIAVKFAALPTIASQAQLDRPIAPTGSLSFRLDQPDQVLVYHLRANQRQVDCTKLGTTLACPLTALELAQNNQYPVSLTRSLLGATAEPVLENSLTTVAPVQITGASVSENQIIYASPQQFSLTLNRNASQLGSSRLVQIVNGQPTELASTASLHDQTIDVAITQPLPRSADIKFVVDSITADDGGYLETPYTLSFRTSGGPKVTGISVGPSKISPASSFVITFDSNLAAGQNLAEYARLESGGGVVAASISARANKLTIKPSSTLDGCTRLTVKILDGLKNEAGISGGSAWSYSTRTICQTITSIGSSVEGRGITAYRFGSGPSKLLFIGGTHGNEKSSVYTLNGWVNYLEAHYDEIPASRSIVVVPNINPDGVAANRRTNSHNVDLNRNFPANDWKSGVTMPSHAYLPTGGGTAPLSEPESQAIAGLVTSLQPRLVLSYHAVAGIVLPNGAADSLSLAGNYDRLSNVRLLPENNGFFDYDTTGAFEGWLNDKLGIATLVVELFTSTGNEFSNHSKAMWSMVQTP